MVIVMGWPWLAAQVTPTCLFAPPQDTGRKLEEYEKESCFKINKLREITYQLPSQVKQSHLEEINLLSN